MNQASSHLTDAQIKNYVQDSFTGPAAERLEAHLTDCESCLDRLLHAERIHLGLLEGNGMKQTPYPGCPPEEILQELAAGICASDTAQTTTEHAAHCNYCGPLLNRYLKEFSEDVQPEDAAVLRELKTSTPGWQKKFIGENFHPENQNQSSTGWFRGLWPRLAIATAAGVAAAVAAFSYLQPNDLEKAQQLVASAYSERRTTEMRFPSAPHTPFQPTRVERSGDSTVDWTSEPGSLLQAEAILNQQRKSGDLNPQWLEVQGRIELLAARPASSRKAADSFDEALRKDPNNINLKIDLAAAYFESETSAEPDHPVLTKTIDLLNQVLKSPSASDQQKATTLFDLAIAYESSNMLDLAVATWEEYLKADPSGSWSDEARSRLQKAKEKIPDPKLQSYVNSKDPSFFLANFSNPVVQQNVEEYQETALTVWLPEALKNPQNASSQAIRKLAESLELQHSDFWLRDLLLAVKPNDLEAAETLAAAIKANRQGLHNQALVESRSANKAFAQSGNNPGRLRSAYEEVFAMRSMLRGRDCLEYAIPLQKRLPSTHYPWLEAELSLELAQCRSFLGDRTNSIREIQVSSNIAKNVGFKVLHLRTAGILVGIQRQQGGCGAACVNIEDALKEYWEGTYPSVRLAQLYGVMWQCASESGYSYTAEALLRQTLEIRKSPDMPRNDIREGVLHLYLAEILKGQGETGAAEREKKVGEALLSSVSEEYSKAFRLGTDIEPAEHELRNQNAEAALATLKPVAELLDKTQDNFLSLRFDRLLGNIYLRLRQFDQAHSAYNSAIQMSEISFADARSDRERAEWLRATGESYRGLVRVLLEQKKPREALERWEWYKSRPLLRETNNESGHVIASSEGKIELQATNTALPRLTEVRVVYASFEDGLQIWVYRNARVSSTWVPVKKIDLQQAVQEFGKQCSTSTSSVDTLQEEGAKLYSLLLRPVASELPEKGVVVVEADDVISDMSLGALRAPSGRYVEELYSIIYSPGIWLERNLRPPQPINPQESALLVDSSHASGSGSLPGAPIERKAISDLFPRLTVVDSATTSWAALRPKVAASEIFIFVGHGRTEGGGAVLVLNSSESLGAKDFSSELLNRERLAVLSACSTGVGREDGFLNTDNLVRSFLSAGVPNVVASRWNVDSKITAQLMTQFYTHLKQGQTVVRAMASARRDILRNTPHPYYWAAFSLEGRAS